jgi:hypothetical protein
MTVTRADWIPKPPPLSWSRRFLLRWTGPTLVLLVASLFVVAFYESWEALQRAGIRGEVADPGPWPWMVDGFILAMAIMVAYAKQTSTDLRWWDRGLLGPRLGLLASTALSAAIQWGYAPHDPWLHAWSPLAVLFSFECLIRLVYGVAVGARGAEVRDGGPPRPGETAEGVPPAARAQSQPSRLVRGTPPPSSVPSPVNGGRRPDTGAVNLPDRAATVTTPPVTVPSRPFTPAEEAVLYRQKDNPERFAAKVAEKGFDPDAALELAARRGWPAANGHRKAVSA